MMSAPACPSLSGLACCAACHRLRWAGGDLAKLRREKRLWDVPGDACADGMPSCMSCMARLRSVPCPHNTLRCLPRHLHTRHPRVHVQDAPPLHAWAWQALPWWPTTTVPHLPSQAAHLCSLAKPAVRPAGCSMRLPSPLHCLHDLVASASFLSCMRATVPSVDGCKTPLLHVARYCTFPVLPVRMAHPRLDA